MNEKDERIQTLKEKAKYFFVNNIEVHIPKVNGLFSRGYIIKVEDSQIILKERKEGTIPVYFLEMIDILKCIKEEEK